jgi:hypothetical protein
VSDTSESTRPSTITSDTGPFAIVPEWVLDAPISDRACRLYGILGRYADRHSNHAWPSRRRLAERLRCSVKSIDRAVAELEAVGALRVERRYDEEGEQTTNLYTLLRLTRGGDTADAPRGGTGDAPPRDTTVPLNENQVEREPVERDLAAAPQESIYDPLKGQKIDGRNLPWDALVKATLADEVAESGRIARALKTIRAIVVRDSSEQTFTDPRNGEWWIARQIMARAGLYRRRWPNMELTPTALATHWSRVVTEEPGRSLEDALDAAQRGIDSAKGAT